jgi:hypothetical protein
MASTDVFNQMKDVITEMDTLNEKWATKGNKSAAGKMRKLSTFLDKLCKQFRKESVAECKKTD